MVKTMMPQMKKRIRMNKRDIKNFDDLKAAQKALSKEIASKKSDLKSSPVVSAPVGFFTRPSLTGISGFFKKTPSRTSVALTALEAAVALVRIAKKRMK